MKENFNKAFDIVIMILEGGGKTHTVPGDPGGTTKYGFAQKYNMDIDVASLTEEQARKRMYERYWKPAGADDVTWPWDICLFDGAVNPQNVPDMGLSGNGEILKCSPSSPEEFLILRMIRYMQNSKEKFKLGHLQRVLRLYLMIYPDKWK